MEHIACRNCGNENVYIDTKDNKVVHYDCLHCNYQWYAPPVKPNQVIFNIVAGFIGMLLTLFGVSALIADIDAFHPQSPVVFLSVGMMLLVIFTYRALRTYRVIKM